jgi:hypothetical protein
MAALGVKQRFSVNAGHCVASEVHLETTTGLLVGRTRTWSTVLWTSVRSVAQALVFDADGDVLMAGPLHPYNVKRTPLGHHERTWNPSWLAGLSSSPPTLETLAGMLADSRMGDLTVGEELRWPDDELPWATWPGGLRGLHPASHGTAPTEQESHLDVEFVAELTGERRT